VKRRTFLKGAAALCAAQFASCAKPRAKPVASDQPRYFLQILLAGGIDPVFGLDPKTRRDLEPRYDAPVTDDQIRASGEVTLGPHLHALLPWADRFSVVRGVSTYSVAHVPGIAAFYAGKIGVDAALGTPSLGEVVGATREPEQICSAVTLGEQLQVAVSPGMLTTDTLTSLLEQTREERLMSADFLAQRRAKLLARVARPDERLKTTAETLATSERLLRKLAAIPGPTPTADDEARMRSQGSGPLTSMDADHRYAELMMRTLWLFKYDLCKSVVLVVREWDSHSNNARMQAGSSLGFFSDLARLLREMQRELVNGVPMLDQTLVFMGSEMGRFPIVNSLDGKHHFPENAYLLMGPGIERGHVFGGTGRDAQSLVADPRTGKPDRAGKKLDLDDLVATVLTATGLNPAERGYYGQRLGLLS
jgi:uncharacterized protein (DUF1501 family)